MKRINLYVGGVGAISFATVTAKILVDILSLKSVWMVAPVVISVSFVGVILGRFRGAVVLPLVYVIVMLFLYFSSFLSPAGSVDAFSGFVMLALPLLPSIIITLIAVGLLDKIVSVVASRFELHGVTNFISYSSNPYMMGLAGISALATNAYLLYRIGLAIDRAGHRRKS